MQRDARPLFSPTLLSHSLTGTHSQVPNYLAASSTTARKATTPARAILLGITLGAQCSVLACWLYVAVVGVTSPQYLSLPFDAFLEVRTDTVGILAFLISIPLTVLTGMLASHCRGRSTAVRLLLSSSRSLAVHGWLGWAYVSANSISHRRTLYEPLTHVFRWPTEGTFALLCFLVAAGASCLYFAARELSSPS